MNYKLIISVLIVLSVLVIPELLFAAEYIRVLNDGYTPNYWVNIFKIFIGLIGVLLTFTGVFCTIKYKKLSIKSFVIIFIGFVFLGFILFTIQLGNNSIYMDSNEQVFKI
jgi:hypothetical protein